MTNDVLTAALTALVTRARRDGTALAALSPAEAAARITGWPELLAANDAAAVVARANSYLPPANDEAGWGRALTERTLATLGIAELLRHDTDLPGTVIPELHAFMAGPAVPIDHLVVLDAGLSFDGEHEVGGWKLFQPSADDLASMLPVPSAARFAATICWDPSLRLGGCSVLRRTEPRFEPRRIGRFLPGHLVTALTEPEFTIAAWEPLLLLNLAQRDRVLPAAEYEVEPGRYVERVRDSGVPVGIAGDEDSEWEVPEFGPCRLTAAETERLLRFAGILSPYLLGWRVPAGATKGQRMRYERLARSTTRFLAIGDRYGSGDDIVRPRDRSEVIFWTISALENVIVPEDNHGDLSRKMRQRVAVLLAGDDDEQRLKIASNLSAAYTIRSAVAHGSQVNLAHLNAAAEHLRTYLRNVLLRLIVLGRSFDVDQVCDRALLSPSVRITEIQHRLDDILPELPHVH